MIEHEKVLDMKNNLGMNKNDAGFNLLELTFVVGLFLFFAVAGLMSYNSVANNDHPHAETQTDSSQSEIQENDNTSNGFGADDQPGPETNEDREKKTANK